MKSNRFETMKNSAFRIAIFICLFCMVCLVSGCGYQFGRSGQLPPGITRVCIPPLQNRANETELSAVLTNDLINEFIKNGYFVTPDRDESDGRLVGEIKYVKTRTVSRVGDHSALERRVEISTAFRLKDGNGNILWNADNISESETYAVSNDGLWTENARRTAVSALSKRLGERIFNLLSDRFLE